MVGISLNSWAFTSGPYARDPIPLDRILARLSEAEYDAIELGGMREFDAGLAGRLEDSGLAVSGYSPDFSAYNPIISAYRTPYLDLFRRALDVCHSLNCASIRVDTVAAPMLNDREYLSIFDYLAGVWADAAEIAYRASVRLVWEFDPTMLFNKPGEVVAMHRKVGHPNFQILFDTANAYRCTLAGPRLSGGAPEFLKKLENRVGAIDIIDCDGTPRPFGEGSIDFNILAPQLLDIPNIRWWSVDLCDCEGAWDLVEPSHEFVLQLINSKVAA